MSVLGFSTLTPSNISIFASGHPTMEKSIVVASGQNLLIGTVMAKKTADGKYYKWDHTKSDGTQTVVGILGCNVDASLADQKAFIYIEGEFNVSQLIAGSSTADFSAMGVSNINAVGEL